MKLIFARTCKLHRNQITEIFTLTDGFFAKHPIIYTQINFTRFAQFCDIETCDLGKSNKLADQHTEHKTDFHGLFVKDFALLFTVYRTYITPTVFIDKKAD